MTITYFERPNMTSHVQHVKKGTKTARGLLLAKRFLLVALIVLIQMIYFPTSERAMGGFEPRLPIDIFPIWSIWVLPYLLCYLLWVVSFLWAIFKMEDQMFRSFVIAFIFTCTVAVLIFLAFPTYVRPFPIPGTDIFSSLLRTIHQDWGRYNALPSGHIYITTLLALFYIRWYPHTRSMWALIVVIVSFSTLFTGQHYVADLFGGLLIAVLGYHVGLKRVDVFTARFRAVKRRLLLPPSS